MTQDNPLIQKGMDRISKLFRESEANLRLRTKLLLSLVLITAGLTCATLVVLRVTAQVQVQRQLEEDARNAMLTFQVMQHQRQTVLSRKADFLATLAYMRNGDASTIQDVSQGPWQADDSDLYVLADRRGKVVGLHTTTGEFTAAAAEEMLQRSLREDSGEGWWFSGKHLYQVVLQPFYEDAPLMNRLLGTVVVGREIDAQRLGDLGRISSSHLVFRRGRDIALSTFPALKEQEVAQQLGDGAAPEKVQIGNERFFASSVELTPGVQPGLSLTVLKSYDEATVFLGRLNHLLVGLGLVAVLAGGALVFVMSDRYTRPLTCLVEGVHALERGDFTYHLEAYGDDEVAQVTRAFDHMRSTLQSNELQRQQLEDQLRQTQKMEALGRLAGGVAHDFNNLLTVIKGHGDLLLERLKPAEPAYASGQQIQKAANRAASLTRQLLAFSRRQVLQPKVLDLNAMIVDMGKLLKRLIREDIELLVRLGESLGRVKADPGQIEQVLLNLTVNACDAMPQGGKLTLETRNVAVDNAFARTHRPIERGHYVLLAVTDTGHGMDANTKVHIFEPFFTTKEEGKGTGLGLATVYGVVKQSDGFIWVESAPGKGARFEIYLPRVREQLDSVAAENTSAASARGFETVLVVEDEEEVRTLASDFLRSAGYRVLSARDGLEALEIAKRRDETIHLLVTDVVMPKMNGPELADQLKRRLPDMKVVYMSGYVEQSDDRTEFLQIESYLEKPFSRDTLVRLVADTLRNGSSARRIAKTSRSQFLASHRLKRTRSEPKRPHVNERESVVCGALLTSQDDRD